MSKSLVPCGVATLLTVVEHGTVYVLMGKRKGAHGYSIPGGRLEPGESDRVCAIRELEEETGIKLAPRDIHSFIPVPYSVAGPGGEPWVTLLLFAPLRERLAARVTEPDKCDGLGLVPVGRASTAAVWGIN